MNLRDMFDIVIGCNKFFFPCWIACKLGFDGLCCSFNYPCFFWYLPTLKLRKKLRIMGLN
ncbi:hypothetical protein ES702_03918 [subsurface metagenome]